MDGPVGIRTRGLLLSFARCKAGALPTELQARLFFFYVSCLFQKKIKKEFCRTYTLSYVFLIFIFIFDENKKEVIQPQVPLRLPCDDLTHLTKPGFGLIKKLSLIQALLEWFDGRCVQGAGTYSLDADNVRLLGIPSS